MKQTVLTIALVIVCVLVAFGGIVLVSDLENANTGLRGSIARAEKEIAVLKEENERLAGDVLLYKSNRDSARDENEKWEVKYELAVKAERAATLARDQAIRDKESAERERDSAMRESRRYAEELRDARDAFDGERAAMKRRMSEQAAEFKREQASADRRYNAVNAAYQNARDARDRAESESGGSKEFVRTGNGWMSTDGEIIFHGGP